jgi:hypothetical protein
MSSPSNACRAMGEMKKWKREKKRELEGMRIEVNRKKKRRRQWYQCKNLASPMLI